MRLAPAGRDVDAEQPTADAAQIAPQPGLAPQRPDGLIASPMPHPWAGVHAVDLRPAAAAVACSGERKRESYHTSWASASRSTVSARPKIVIAYATELPVSECRSLCAS